MNLRTQPTRDGLNIDSFYWGASQPASMSIGGGGGAGRVTFQDLSVSTSIDKAAPALLAACTKGKHISKVELSASKTGGSPVEYYRITLEEVIVTGVNYDASSDGQTISIHYTFQAARVLQQYREQSAHGGKGPEVASGWDIKGNREI